MIGFDVCEGETPSGPCGSAHAVDRYLVGLRCLPCAPAALAGRVLATPNPAATIEGLSHRPISGPDSTRYGDATTDPLGRSIPGDSRTGMIPRHACPSCPRLPVGHKGECRS